MSHPVVAATAVTNASADQTSHIINLPTGIAAGDLLLLWFTKDNAVTTVTTPTNWTLSGSAASTDTAHLFTKTATGSEGSTVTITTSNIESSSAVSLRITGWTSFSSAVNFQASTSVFGCGDAITPSPASPTAALTVSMLGVPGNITTPTQQPGIAGTVAATGSLAVETHCRVIWAPTVVSNEEDSLFLPSQVLNSSAYRWGHVLVYGGELGGGVRIPNVNGGADQ